MTNDDRAELAAIVAEEAAGTEHFIGSLLADNIACAIIAAGFKRVTK